MGLRREGRGFPSVEEMGRAGGRDAGRLVADSVAHTDEYVSTWIDGALLMRRLVCRVG